MICDLAETYHIYDYRALPVRTLAELVCGLRDDSRVMQKISGLPDRLHLMAYIADRLTNIAWMLTGSTDNPSYFLFDKAKVKGKQMGSFSTPDAFHERWDQINKGESDG